MKAGSHHTLEARAKMSKSRMGISTAGRKRKPLSSEHKKHLSEANKGKSPSAEHRKHLSEALRGRKRTPEQIAKLSEAHKGKMHAPETKKKMSVMRKGRRCGEDNPFWHGGTSFEPYCPKFNKDMKRRIRAFFEHKCVLCGKTTEENGSNLSCHHVEYNKNACCDGKPVHFAALCHKCHSRTNVDRERWEAMIHRAIEEIYDGRS